MHQRKLPFLFNRKDQLSPETSQIVRPNNSHQTLKLRLISLENLIDEIQEKLKQLEVMILKLNGQL